MAGRRRPRDRRAFTPGRIMDNGGEAPPEETRTRQPAAYFTRLSFLAPLSLAISALSSSTRSVTTPAS